MLKRRNGPARWDRPLVAAAIVATVLLVITSPAGPMPVASADPVDCATVKCVALTFDDGPGPDTDRLLSVLADNNARATFFLIGDKVVANPAGAHRIAEAGMEIGNHTFDHPDLTASAATDVRGQLSSVNDAITAATGATPSLWRPPGGLTNDSVNRQAGHLGMAGILWDVISFDWINDADTAATRAVLMSQTGPGSVVLLHDTHSATVDVVAQFIPVLKANGYHLVTVSQLLGSRAPGSIYGGRENGPPVNVLRDIPG